MTRFDPDPKHAGCMILVEGGDYVPYEELEALIAASQRPPMSSLCNCDRRPYEHEVCECYGLPISNDLLQEYIDGKFSEDLKWRGQELCRELLATRQRLDNLQLSYNMLRGNRLGYNR